MPAKPRVTKVQWHYIAEVGYAPKELRVRDTGAARSFLVKGDWSLFVAYLFQDGSGFDTDEADCALAWALVEGF